MAILQACPTPKELSEIPFEELCHLIEVSSHKRFRMAKARELQELARNSFGFAMAGDVFSTMIRLYAKHLDFLKQQVREMDRKIAEIMETLDTPITTITGIGPTLGAYILSEIGDISRFSSAAKLAAYAGIDPTMRQSGEYNGIRNRMSKRGSPYGAITQESERKCAYLKVCQTYWTVTSAGAIQRRGLIGKLLERRLWTASCFAKSSKE